MSIKTQVSAQEGLLRLLRLAAPLALALSLFSAPARAGQDHLGAAIAETERAIHYGNERHHDSSFVEHAENALRHAVSAQKASPNPHTRKAISYLRKAINKTEGTHMFSYLQSGAKTAKKALAQLQAAQ